MQMRILIVAALSFALAVAISGCGGSANSVGSVNAPPTPAAASPTFTSVAPATGFAGGGTALTVTGANFRSGATFKIGGNAAQSVVLVNSTTITAILPSHGTGTVDIIVANSDGTSGTGSGAFTYTGNPVPTVSSSSPAAIQAGAAITQATVLGTGYTEQSTLALDGVQVSSAFVSPTQLTATFPAASLSTARLARLTVTNPPPGGGSSDTGPAFSVGPTLPSPIYGETATVLQSGRVLVCGGANPNTGVATTDAELYNPATNQFTAVGAMTVPRYRHTATLLNNGKVLITGGLAVTSGFLQTYQSTELFDPATNTFTASGNMIAGRRSHTASLLASGKVLISGGTSNTGTVTVTSEIYDPGTNAFSTGPQMIVDRYGHAAVSLTDGTVLIVGGAANTISGGVASASGTYLSAAELYNPVTNGFVAVDSMQSARSLPAVVRMADGRVFVAGGISNVGVVNPVEIYNPTTQAFSTTGANSWAGYYENAVLLADGKILVTGGFGLTSYLQQGGITQFPNSVAFNDAAIYDPATAAFTQIPNMTSARAYAAAVLLPSGNVLIAGGTPDNINSLSSTDLLTRSNLTTEYLIAVQNPTPTITGVSPTTSYAEGPLTITGSGFTNTSEVLLNGSSLEPTNVSSSQITITMPASYGQYSINILNPSPGGGVSNTFQQIGHAEIVVEPIAPLWLPSSTHALVPMLYGGGTYSTTIREGSTCGSFGSSACSTTSSSSYFCPSATTYIAPATDSTCHIDYTSSVDPSATTTVTATITSSGLHATSVNLQTPRIAYFGSTLLATGNVLITGGDNGYQQDVTAAAEMYNFSAHSTQAMPNMTTPRSAHTSTLLSNGTVLITGGFTLSSGSTTAAVTSSAELFNPTSNTFTLTSPMSNIRAYHLAAVLPSGDVLIAGGCDSTQSVARSTEVYSVAKGVFLAGPSMLTPHCSGQATVLQSGQILISGGFDSSTGMLVGSELYDPISSTFAAVGAMVQQRYSHTATLLPNGEVLLVGGFGNAQFLFSSEYYNPATKSFTAGPTLAEDRQHPAAAVIPSLGQAVIVGGGLAPIETISTTGALSSIGELSIRDQETAVVLSDGSLFLAGGNSGGQTADIVTFGAAAPANPAPSISEAIPFYSQPSIQGYDFNPGAQVLVDGLPVAQTYVYSSDLIKFNIGSLGTHSVQVKNPDGKLSNILQQTF